jgi:hypothetical protein
MRRRRGSRSSTRRTAPRLTYPLSIAGMPTAWAFALWGGDFWVFLMKGLESSTTVYQYDSNTGALKSMMQASGRTIVGAGVSTCAPVIL